MSEAETTNKANSRRFFEELWNKGNLALVDELVAPRHVSHDPNNPNQAPGPEGVRQLVSLYRNAFPDLHFTIRDIVAEGDRVVTRVTASGTHQRDLPGIPATGKRAEIEGIVIVRYEDGKAAEDWVSFDFLGFMRQLGVIPKMGEVPAATTR
ncbi:MAG: hypothetical protein AUH85_14965 [Chloroflexi bacterium 13_1_40CM_4_68_4]|nr:MAG: hypothetical protein AUH85_14965 [Chloroflexi bacterium 13_1_40CM_4_68_4]